MGLSLAAVIFLLFAGRAPSVARLDDLGARLAVAPPERMESGFALASLPRLVASPLFNLTTGPGALVETPVALTGVAMAPHQSAALIAISSGPAQWLALGASRGGVTLTEVHANKVVVDTPTGFKEIRLWDQVPADAPAHPVAPAPGLATPLAPPQTQPADPSVVSH